MKIRTKAWIMVIAVGWTYPIWWMVVKVTNWVFDSVDIVEEKLQRRDERKRAAAFRTRNDP